MSTNAQNLELVSHDSNSVVVRTFTPADQKEIEVTMLDNGKTWRARASVASADSLYLAGPWQFRPEPDQVSVPYAQVKDVPANEGEKLGFAQPDFDDSTWSSFWLSEAQNTIRNWNVIGPFPNQDDSGFATVFPPETKFDPQAHYKGLNDSVVHWERYYGDEPYLSKALIVMETSGGHFDDDSSAVDLNRVFRLEDNSWMIGYAQTYLYSPIDQPATFIVASGNWAKIWLNGTVVFGQLRHPVWYELHNDNWADRFSVILHQGWNEVLVKVGVGRVALAPTGTFGFVFRVADAQGKAIPTLTSSLAPISSPEQTTANTTTRWYRIPIPPGTTAVLPPALEKSYRLFLNGQGLRTNGATPINYEKLLRPEKNVLVIVANSQNRLSSPIRFVSGNTPFMLQSWTRTGLANFSGSAIHEKSISLPQSFQGKRVMLDLGRVSSVAEVQVNGRDAGTLVWRPYRLDITEFLHSGENRLRIRITNTEANARAVGGSHNILPNIDLCGLEGPVQIIPYVDQTLTLRPE